MGFTGNFVELASTVNVPLRLFDDSLIPVLVVGKSGTLYYANETGLRVVWGKRYTYEQAIGRSLIALGPESFFSERVAFISKQIDASRPGVIRSIRHGQQSLVHIRPLSMVASISEPVALMMIERRPERLDDGELGTVDLLDPIAQDLGKLATLSPRELEVLAYVGLGWGVDQTAQKLHRSRETVISHRKSLMRKLACTNATELAMIATRAGLHPRDGERMSHVNTHKDVR